MKGKVSLKEKIRRVEQAEGGFFYKDGSGGKFTMTKVKGGYRLNKPVVQ